MARARLHSLTKREQALLDQLREIEVRLSVLEAMPRPIIFAIGRMYPEPIHADMQAPSEMEH